MSVLIGISGLANTGKDTTANFFVEEFGFVNISFADPIKRYCADIFDWDEETLWGPSENRNIPDKRYPKKNQNSSCDYFEASRFGIEPEETAEYLTPRHALQSFGDFGKGCYEDIWIEYGIKTAKKILNNSNYGYIKSKGVSRRVGYQSVPPVGGVVFADCRFFREISLVKEFGGVIIRIKRLNSGLKGKAAKHSSETEQLLIKDNEFDFILDNNGTIKNLKNKTFEIGQKLGLAKLNNKQLELPWG